MPFDFLSGRRADIFEKIFERVIFVDGPMSTPCWEWTGPDSGTKGRGKGYARMCLNGQTVAVHRAMYGTIFGYVPGKKQIDHRCRNRLCCNPVHLEMVTHKANQKRRMKGIPHEI